MSISTARTAQQVSTHLRIASDLMAGAASQEVRSAADQRLSEQVSRFNVARLLSSLADPGSGIEAPNEQFVGASIARSKSGGIGIPFSALARDLTAGTASAGGNLIGKQPTTDVAEWLRPNSFAAASGATIFQGLRESFSVPYLTAGATASVVAENVAGAASDPAFGVVNMQAFTIQARTVISRRLDIQSPSIAALVSNDLSAAVAAMLDYLVLNGSGTGDEPLGLLNHSGVNVYALGANGAAVNWAALAEMEQLVDKENFVGQDLAYVTSPKVRRDLRAREAFAGGSGPIWTVAGGQNEIQGVRAYSSNHVPTNLSKGTGTNLSAIVYGCWSEVVIGVWGDGISIMVDPRGSIHTGAVRVTAMLDVAIGIRRAKAFSVCKDVVTT